MKGIKLVTAPPLLTIVLSRFTLDYTTFTRVKLQDRVSFGQLINMNEFINTAEGKLNRYD